METCEGFRGGMNIIKIGIIGTRSRDSNNDFLIVREALYKVIMSTNVAGGVVLVSGGCLKGGDRFAEIIAKSNQLDIIIYYPDKSKLDPEKMKKNPKWAYAEINYTRNTLIANNCDILIVCVNKDSVYKGGRHKGGTEDTIKKFINRPGKSEKDLILV